MDQIKQIMPAPGWKVLRCILCGGKASIFEVPVVGWGIYSHSIEEQYDAVHLMVFADRFIVKTVDDLGDEMDGAVETFAPGEEITDDDRAVLESAAREKQEIHKRKKEAACNR